MRTLTINDELNSKLTGFWTGSAGVLHHRRSLAGSDRGAVEAAMLTIGARLGTPLHVIRRWPMIHEVSVRLVGESTRFGGVGENAFHTDIVNSREPPDAVVFACLRPDPLGGGLIKAADMSSAVHALPPGLRERVPEVRLHEGRFFDLDGVGGELNPFPLVERSDFTRYRYAARAAEDVRNGQWFKLLRALGEGLERCVSTYRLEAGDLLVLNQRSHVHARSALGSGQESLEEHRRRLWLRLFVRR